jgi:hypothetical protein
VYALATSPVPGVHQDGRVTGSMVCSDPAAFEEFLGRQAIGGSIAAALFVSSSAMDAVGNPIIRRLSHHQRAASAWQGQGLGLSSMGFPEHGQAMRLPVTRVASDGDRMFVTLLGLGCYIATFARWDCHAADWPGRPHCRRNRAMGMLQASPQVHYFALTEAPGAGFPSGEGLSRLAWGRLERMALSKPRP